MTKRGDPGIYTYIYFEMREQSDEQKLQRCLYCVLWDRLFFTNEDEGHSAAAGY